MECIFDIEYINHAWGFHHYGTLIMPNGTIRQYDFSSDKNKNQKSLSHKVKKSSVVGHLKFNQIHQLCTLLTSVQTLSVKSMGRTAFDAGSTSFQGYRRQSKGTWQLVPLSSGGDWTMINPDTHAKTLVKLLSRLTGKQNVPGLTS